MSMCDSFMSAVMNVTSRKMYVKIVLELLCGMYRYCVLGRKCVCVCFGVCAEISPLWCGVVCADILTPTPSHPSVRGLLRDWEV